jgi:hypothetical protein
VEDSNSTLSSSPAQAPGTAPYQPIEKAHATTADGAAAVSTESQVGQGGLSSGPPTKEEIEVFQALDLRVGEIHSCEKHPDADRWEGGLIGLILS